ncbi:MAG: hypothetical protein P4L50_23625 [Anaerolineaceae bacterium]|nr:hypothetical protein [Anaerolineaceae bacterium]
MGAPGAPGGIWFQPGKRRAGIVFRKKTNRNESFLAPDVDEIFNCKGTLAPLGVIRMNRIEHVMETNRQKVKSIKRLVLIVVHMFYFIKSQT